MSRWKASGLHLLLSGVIVGGIAAAALTAWFPHGLYRVAGLDRLLLIMLGIDLVAGPLLTLVVYKAGKPGLRKDLAVVGLCQVALLAYGMHALWSSRPVFLVGSEVRINLVFANEIDDHELARAPREDWRRLSWTGPRLVGVKAPSDERERQVLMLAFMSSGVDLDRLPAYYVPYEDISAKLLQNAGPSRVVPLVSRYGIAGMQLDAHGKPERVTSQPPASVR